VITYAYNGLLRLTDAVEGPGTAFKYAYDDAGNRTHAWQNDTLAILLRRSGTILAASVFSEHIL
jgi:YD repeat-containing protein